MATKTDFQKVARCKTELGTTYGYIYTKNGWYAYYMCGSSIPEFKGTLEEVENYVRSEWNLDITRMDKFRNK